MASPTSLRVRLEIHNETNNKMLVRVYKIPDSAMIRAVPDGRLAPPIALLSCATRKIR